MACNSEHPAQTGKESELQKVAQFYRFVLQKLNIPSPKALEASANSADCTNDYTEALCYALEELNEQQMERIVYDGRNKQSRALADWWEAHLKADKERLGRKEPKNLAERLQLKERQKMVEQSLDQAILEKRANAEFDHLIGQIDQFFAQTLAVDLEAAYSGDKAKPNYIYKAKGKVVIALKKELGWTKTLTYALAHRDFHTSLNIESGSIDNSAPGALTGNKNQNLAWEYVWDKLKEFARKNGFSNCTLTYGHDGVGMESWPEAELRF